MNTSNKIYLIGATSQAANPATYSHDTAYVGTDGCLYSNSKKVATVGDSNTFTGNNTFNADTRFKDSISIYDVRNPDTLTATLTTKIDNIGATRLPLMEVSYEFQPSHNGKYPLFDFYQYGGGAENSIGVTNFKDGNIAGGDDIFKSVVISSRGVISYVEYDNHNDNSEKLITSYKLPHKDATGNYTLATTDDISNASYFNNEILFMNPVQFTQGIKDSASGSIISLPGKGGTFALTSDLPVANSGPSTTTLASLKIGDTIYSIPKGDVTAAGSNIFTGGTNKFTQKPTFSSGFYLGLTAGSPEVNDLWGIEKDGFKAAGSSLGTQTIKFPDLSTFSVATHTIPLNDTDNTFTGTNTFETEFQSSLYRTIIDKNGVSVGSGPSSGILVSTAYDYNRIKYTNSGTTYMYYFPLANGTIALSEDVFKLNGENTSSAINTYSGAAYFNANTYFTKTPDFQSGKIQNGAVILTFPQKSGTIALTSDINVILAGNNTFTGTNTFTKDFSVYDEVSGYRSTLGYSALTLEDPVAHNTCILSPAGLVHKQMSSDGAITLHNTTLAFGNNGSTTTITVPNKTGTLALTSDIPDTSNFVTLSGAQTISGNKTFNNHIILPNGPDGYIEFGNWRFFGYLLSNNVTSTSLSFPSGKNGTIATTSDIPIKTATLSGTTLSITLS